MRASRVMLAYAIAGVLCLSAGIALAQTDDKPVTVADILKEAKCPLTEAQAKQLKDLDMSQGRAVFQTLNDLFDEKQTEALKKALGTRAGRNGGPDRPRYLTQAIVFEKAGCPLTQKQLKALLAIEPGQGSRDAMNAVLTDKQKEEMQKVMPRRQQ